MSAPMTAPMSAPMTAPMTGLVRRVRRWSAAQWALRAVLLAGIAGALFAPGLDGHPPDRRLVAIGLVLTLAAVVESRGDATTVALCWVLVVWAVTDRGVGVGALAGAAGLVAAHLAAALAAYGPDRMTCDRGLVLLWLRRGVVVLMPSAVVTGVGSVVSAPSGSLGVMLWVAAVVCVAALALAISIVRRAR